MQKYGLNFGPEYTELHIEFFMIRSGGKWIENGHDYGLGLFEHYRRAETLIWPDDDHHRWSDLGLSTITNNEVSVFMGSSDSNKTYMISRFVLTDWWAFSDNTLWLISSTELRGAELRIWGKLKELFNRARQQHPWLPGRVLESKHSITTEEISEDQSEARLLTKGLIFIPCKQGGKYIGMGAYAGIKPTRNGRLGHAGDEVSYMTRAFLDAYSNWYGKVNFRGIMSGNPFDLEDPLCVAGEPIGGWDNWVDTGKTQTWRGKFYNAAVVVYDGRDSPNLDYPETDKVHFPYMIGRKKLKAVSVTHGEDSWQWFNQCVGKPRPGILTHRVITRKLCEDGHAFDAVVWDGSPRTKLGACDAAYGGLGGDRCIFIDGEFGKIVDGSIVLAINEPMLVPVSISNAERPEIQIAKFVKRVCEIKSISPGNFFFDGRGTLAIEMAREWSDQVNVVDFGGPATTRPVTMDTYVWDGDLKTRRLQTCKEAYSKMVTELWWTVHYVILSGQMRGLPKDVADEGCKREWRPVAGNRIEVETKAEMKERTHESPDLFDSLVTLVEGARRRGFQIRKLANEFADDDTFDFLSSLRTKSRDLRKAHALSYR